MFHSKLIYLLKSTFFKFFISDRLFDLKRNVLKSQLFNFFKNFLFFFLGSLFFFTF